MQINSGVNYQKTVILVIYTNTAIKLRKVKTKLFKELNYHNWFAYQIQILLNIIAIFIQCVVS